VEGEAEKIRLALIDSLTFNRARLGQRQGGPQYYSGEASTSLSTDNRRALWDLFLVTIPKQDQNGSEYRNLPFQHLRETAPMDGDQPPAAWRAPLS
jgi:hypothetical protein